MNLPSAGEEFAPDSSLVGSVHPSPNVGARKNGAQPSMLILHYTGLETVARSIFVLADPACGVSCHYVIDEAGGIVQMVPEALRAWHAGVSSWAGETDINSHSIGIEVQNPGHDNGYPEFPPEQMKSVVALAKDIVARNRIPTERVLAHSDVAPQRKSDPGEKFDWQELARAGVGPSIEPEPLDAGEPLAVSGDEVGVVAETQRLLARYGYDCPQTGAFDAATFKVVIAFQRHFRPGRVDGRIDRSTYETLKRLCLSTQKSS